MPEQSKKEENDKIIDVADVGDCLFWATMMSYLDSVKTDEKRFEMRYKKLFGISDNWKEMYQNFSAFDTKDKKNHHFVSTFRKNVINYMKIKKDELSTILEDNGICDRINELHHNHPNNIKKIKVENVENYLELMEQDYIWGSDLELKFISDFLKVNIILKKQIIENGKIKYLDVNFIDKNINTNEIIKLLFINENHYQYYSNSINRVNKKKILDDNKKENSLSNQKTKRILKRKVNDGLLNNNCKRQILLNENKSELTNKRDISLANARDSIKNQYKNNNIDNQTYNGIIDMYIGELSKIALDKHNKELEKIIFELHNQDKIYANPDYYFEENIKQDINSNFDEKENCIISTPVIR